MKLSWSSRAEIARAQEQLAKEGKLEKYNRIRIIRERYKINISEDSLLIYEILIQTNWSLSNSEIAKFLRENDYTATSWKRSKQFFTNKIVRARKRLTDKGIIPRYNALFEEKREEAISLISQKPLTWATNKEIAEMLWLKEEQINNLVRQLKKEGKYVKP